MAREVQLTKGQVAIVDDADYEWLTQWKWHYTAQGYAASRMGAKQPITLMHRLILSVPFGLMADHINSNRLDNRRSNLRLCTPAQNAQNVTPRKGGTSQYRGVHFSNYYQRWVVHLNYEGRCVLNRTYKTEIEAARAYDAAARRYYGEFARLNLPEEGQ